MNKRFLLLIISLLVGLGASAQIHLSTDKSCYLAGEQIHCSVFTADGDAVAYVQLFDISNMAASTKVALHDGRGGGSLYLPLTLPTGNYRMVAFTATGSTDAFVIPVYNAFSTERLNNVSVVESVPNVPMSTPLSKGLSIKQNGHIISLTNTGSKPVSTCLSISMRDIMSPSARLGMDESFGKTGSKTEAPEADGEILSARLVGPDASKIAGLESVTAVISFPGQKSDVYTCQIPGGGVISIPTENVFGKRDIACMLYGMPEGSTCHIEVDPKICDEGKLPANTNMQMSSGYADALLSRARVLKAESDHRDTLIRTLPVRRPHFFLDKECRTYILDDYTRFPTMEEEFVEIIKNVRRRRGEDRTRQIQIAITPDPLSNAFKWGTALAMIDGVPIFDHKQIWSYDPAMVKAIEIYPYEYALGYRVYEGVVNIVTFKGNLPIIAFDDNVRLYDFEGCSYPVEYKGISTLYWHPLISLEPGETVEVDCSAARYGSEYDVTSEGVSSEGQAVYATGTFKF